MTQMDSETLIPPSTRLPLRLIADRVIWLLLVAAAFGLFLAGVPEQVNAVNRGVVGVFITPGGESGTGLVTQVTPGSQAEQAGIQAGDILRSVNGLPAVQVYANGSYVFHLRTLSSPQARLQVEHADGSQRTVDVSLVPPEQLPWGLTPHSFAWIVVGIDILFALVHILLSGVILWRVRTDAHTAHFALLMAAALIVIPLRVPSEYGLLIERGPHWVWLDPLLPFQGYIFIPLVLALFPNGRWYPRWIWVYPLVSIFYGTLISILETRWLAESQTVSLLLDSLVTGFGLVVQFIRYRNVATPVERQQTKWALFGILIGFLGYYAAGLLFQSNLLYQAFPAFALSPSGVYLLTHLPRLAYLPLLAIPAALSFSILRRRLWDIDLIIRRTLLYTLLTSGLALIYAGLVVAFQFMFRAATGQDSILAIVASTLAITALFNPGRRWIQKSIDRRFYRSQYDANLALEAFTTRLRSQVDLDHLTSDIAQVVDETIQPEHVSLWLFRKKTGS